MMSAKRLARELRAYRIDHDERHFKRIAKRLRRLDERGLTAAVGVLNEHSEESLRFLESSHGTDWRRLLDEAPLAVHLPPLERLAVSYHLLAQAEESSPTLGWSPFRVSRPRPDVPDPTGGIPVPIPVRRGHRTSFERGERTLAAPDTRWLTIENAIVQDGGSVRSGDTWVAYEPPADSLNSTFVSGLWQTHWGTRAHPDIVMLKTAPPAREVIDEGILIAGRNDDNWYQFLVFYLPRVLDIPDTIPADVPLLVTRRTLPGGIEALMELTDRPLRYIDPGESQRVKRLHVGPPVGNMRDDGYDDWSKALTASLPPLRALRARWGVDVPRVGRGRRIFLHRNAARRGVVNGEEIATVAREAGLEFIDPATLSFAEQREIFSSAELVVGATGAVMANYLLMRPGARIVGLTSDHLHDFISPPAMAWIAGCEFEYVTGPATVRKREVEHLQHWVQADFVIPAKTLRRAIQDAAG